jgi:hypothetical protein
LWVWKGVLHGQFDAVELHETIPFRKHSVHGHVDREIWEPKTRKEVGPPIVRQIADKVSQVIGNTGKTEKDSLAAACWNYANYYKDGTHHTFAHRDFNCNPGESVTIVCFGGERMLAFCDCTKPATSSSMRDRYILLPLSDGSIVQFDGRWNMLHYHKLLKESRDENHEAEPRVSQTTGEPSVVSTTRCAQVV